MCILVSCSFSNLSTGSLCSTETPGEPSEPAANAPAPYNGNPEVPEVPGIPGVEGGPTYGGSPYPVTDAASSAPPPPESAPVNPATQSPEMTISESVSVIGIPVSEEAASDTGAASQSSEFAQSIESVGSSEPTKPTEATTQDLSTPTEESEPEETSPNSAPALFDNSLWTAAAVVALAIAI